MIDPISIALVPEDDNRENFYAVSSEYDENKVTAWLAENVTPHLPEESQRQTNDHIRDSIAAYLAQFKTEDAPAIEVEIWAYNGATDDVVLANFFGGLMNLRKAFNDAGLASPQFRDLKELTRATGERLPPPENAHDCLEDAIWARKLFRHLAPKLTEAQKFLL